MDGADLVAARAEARHEELARPTIVGIAGAVASGKTTFATEIGVALGERGLRFDIVSTDGFLLPNHELAKRGLLGHKGFPESYDTEALRGTLDALRDDRAVVHVPVYSHESYDVVPGSGRVIGHVDVVVLEGVNAIGAARDRLDVAVFVEADEIDLERWYVARFLHLVAIARGDRSSFYASMVDLGPADVERIARSTWRSINLVNLREHIGPTRALADIVVVKGPDHRVVEVREHAPRTD
jgi:type I pantothenate kinase